MKLEVGKLYISKAGWVGVMIEIDESNKINTLVHTYTPGSPIMFGIKYYIFLSDFLKYYEEIK